MPTYDYQCRACGRSFEVIHPMTEDGPTTCEVCGGELRRILHPAGIIFKGSGFYKTDSRSSSSASVPAGSKAPVAGEGAGPKTDGTTAKKEPKSSPGPSSAGGSVPSSD